MNDEEDKKAFVTIKKEVPKSRLNNLPLLPLRDVVVYPDMVIPLFVGREKSIQALESAMASGKQVLLVTQLDANKDDPNANDLYKVGTISSILQLLKLPDGTVKVLVEGIKRGRIVDFKKDKPFFIATVEYYVSTKIDEKTLKVLIRSLASQFEQYVKLNRKVSVEVLTSLASVNNPVRLIDTICAHMSIQIADKQKILEITNLQERIEYLMTVIESEIDLLQVEQRIRNKVKRQMEDSQKKYYLGEQLKAIQKELGELDESGVNEIESLIKKVEGSGMTKEAKEHTMSEIKRLRMMSPMSAEATVCRNYIDWMLKVPWKKYSKEMIDLTAAEKRLNIEHYGLETVKERILEYLAVQKRVGKVKGPVLCLVGPPGVGKTSLGRSIAKATKREFVRMSLGGLRDEAEIRGHRKTYIGAMPGRIIQKLGKVGVKNPLFLLDEVDKMAMDFRGDPASALLEVLDPEQNNTFNDHYLEVDYDLSDIMFVVTANSLNIPPPLLDRMEIIRIAGYTENEKLNIAIKYLIPKQKEAAGLKETELKIPNDTITEIIRYYTREAGVRNLEREISKLSRKVVKEVLLGTKKNKKVVSPSAVISVKKVEKFLGVRKYHFGVADEVDRVGQVTGLAWTEVGGDILTIEAASMPGTGKVMQTGKLGDVMKESIQAAMTVVRYRSTLLSIEKDFYQKYDVHIHVPEGATPKDGPSAGIAMCTAIVSMFAGIPVKKDVAMTGEITLRGLVLPIGGLKEKLLAAKRGGIKEVIIPEDNKKDLKEISKEIYQGVNIHPVRWIDEVWQLALTKDPKIEMTKNGKVKSKASSKKVKGKSKVKVKAKPKKSKSKSTRSKSK